MYLDQTERDRVMYAINTLCVALVKENDIRCQESFRKTGKAALVGAITIIGAAFITHVWISRALPETSLVTQWLPNVAGLTAVIVMVSMLCGHAARVQTILNSFPRERTIEQWQRQITTLTVNENDRQIFLRLCDNLIAHDRTGALEALAEARDSPSLYQLQFVQYLTAHYPRL